MHPRESAKIGERRAGPMTAWGVGLLLLGLLLVAGPVAAYANGAADHPHPGSSSGAMAVLLLSAAGVTLAVARRRRRATIVVALALLVGLFGLESAIHSVHHLSDPQAAASCALFSASQHTQSDDVPTPATGVPTWTSGPSLARDLRAVVPLPAFSAHDGRAPPVLLSA
jgi:hypothetical protein